MNAVAPKWSGKVAALDTNLLLLWLAGLVDPVIVARWDRLNMYEWKDWELLNRLLHSYSTVITTPHVLTETSNFAHQLAGYLGKQLIEQLTSFASEAEEHYQKSSLLSGRPEFAKFGLTDCALTEVGDSVTVITADFPLAGHLAKNNRKVINFTQYRLSGLIP